MLGREKVFNDPIHGHIELHPLCVAVIDTPQFQRLKDIRQLGGVYDVFPGASHHRFEHCIGVSYLAGLMLEHLARHQPELGISARELICIRLAGLCHDLGHGPMSHLFDRAFIRAAVPGTKWEHEAASADMLDYLIEDNGLRPTFAKWGLDDAAIKLVKELIFGHPDEAPEGWEWAGAGPEKAFLFEIVANKRNGIDVDKFDYFSRDCHQLGMKWSFDARRLMKFSRVVNVDGELQICFHEKEIWNLYELFHTRYNLHKRAYQHRVARAVETMYTEALLKANDHILLPSATGAPKRMSEAVSDMTAYAKLSDCVLKQIEYSTSEELAPARAIIRRVRTRDLYAFVGEGLVPPQSTLRISKADIAREVLAFCRSVELPSPGAVSPVATGVTPTSKDGISGSLMPPPPVPSPPRAGAGTAAGPPTTPGPGASTAPARPTSPDDLVVDIVVINYGKGINNPVDSVRFYHRVAAPGAPLEGGPISRDKVSCFIPQYFQERYVRLYTKSAAHKQIARAAFENWCSINLRQQPMPMSPPRKRQRGRTSVASLSQP